MANKLSKIQRRRQTKSRVLAQIQEYISTHFEQYNPNAPDNVDANNRAMIALKQRVSTDPSFDVLGLVQEVLGDEYFSKAVLEMAMAAPVWSESPVGFLNVEGGHVLVVLIRGESKNQIRVSFQTSPSQWPASIERPVFVAEDLDDYNIFKLHRSMIGTLSGTQTCSTCGEEVTIHDGELWGAMGIDQKPYNMERVCPQCMGLLEGGDLKALHRKMNRTFRHLVDTFDEHMNDDAVQFLELVINGYARFELRG